MRGKMTTSVFILLLGTLSLVNLLTPVRSFSENENRYLQQLPEFSANALMDGSYTADIDKFVTDQFAFRDSWVGLKTLGEVALGKESSGGVYFGGDGYLIEMFDTVNMSRYEQNLEHVASFAQQAGERMGIPVHTVLAPTAALALADNLPRFAPEVDQRELLNLAEEQLPGFVDVNGTLAAHSDEYIYYKTDHHWTTLGAFYAYNHWRKARGLSPRPLEDFTQEILSDSFYGTNYTKASLYTAKPDTITAFQAKDQEALQVDYNMGETVTDTLYAGEFLEQKDKYSVFLNANQPITHITTGNRNGKKLMVIKDSYANSFIQMAVADYEELYIVDLRYYKTSVLDFMEEQGVTEALVLYNLKGFAADVNLYYLTR